MLALACYLTPMSAKAATVSLSENEPEKVPVTVPETDPTKAVSPDMAFLEYLADLVEVDGELVGPMDMLPGNDVAAFNVSGKGDNKGQKGSDTQKQQPRHKEEQ